MAPWESAIRHTFCAMEMMTAKMDTMSWIVLLIHHAMKATSSVFPMKKVFISSVYQTAICVIHSKTVLMDMMK
jgi:hypothetical protein